MIAVTGNTYPVNQPNECGLSRAGSHSHTRRDIERVFGPLRWMEGADAGADERNAYVVQVAKVQVSENGRLF